ncbi:MAG: uracil phosphoribosyltransferase [Deltaproteobacteria bacterium]|nr:uracil phosphoribosyltransferase [Deltaproteobacteria bacterium]
MSDVTYQNLTYRLPEIEHRYGPSVHILSDPVLLSHVGLLAARTTQQPLVNRLVTNIYYELIRAVVNAEFPRKRVRIDSRMIEHNPRGFYDGEIVDATTRVVTVDIARAGTLPSQICFDTLNGLLDPTGVRQDHFIMARTTDEAQHVIGANISGSKIGGDIRGRIVLFPDPMGATGSSLSTAIRVYKDQYGGGAQKMITINIIVTPEYIRRMQNDHPDVLVYAVRLDRGLSDDDVLASVPGTHWDRERGLNEHQYIVPGGGGLGEVMNNAYC